MYFCLLDVTYKQNKYLFQRENLITMWFFHITVSSCQPLEQCDIDIPTKSTSRFREFALRYSYISRILVFMQIALN